MPLRIKPRKERRSNGVYWVVSLGRNYTGSCRQRRYFGSRKDATTFIAQSEEARVRLGREAFVLPMNLRAEVMACSQRLKPLNASLTQAVEFFVRNAPQHESAKSIEELKVEFLKSRRAMNCRPRTLVQYESYLRVLCADFGKVDVTSILRQDIEDWLEESDWSPRTRKNYLVTLTTILNFAVNKGYRANNPAASIDRPSSMIARSAYSAWSRREGCCARRRSPIPPWSLLSPSDCLRDFADPNSSHSTGWNSIANTAQSR